MSSESCIPTSSDAIQRADLTCRSLRTWLAFRQMRYRRSRLPVEIWSRSHPLRMGFRSKPSTSGMSSSHTISSQTFTWAWLTGGRSGEGRGDSSGKNLYENFAETGASAIFPPSERIINLADTMKNMESEAKEEEAKDKEIQAEIVRKTSLKKRMGMTGMAAASSGGSGGGVDKEGGGGSGGSASAARVVAERQLSGVEEQNENEEEVLAEEGGRDEGVDMDARGRASESPHSSSGEQHVRGSR